jgi:HSP20 family molecular chaperone IbpA
VSSGLVARDHRAVDVDKIDAHFKNGVLTVILPKKAAAVKAEKKITVKAA